jgi:hypothetical protein
VCCRIIISAARETLEATRAAAVSAVTWEPLSRPAHTRTVASQHPVPAADTLGALQLVQLLAGHLFPVIGIVIDQLIGAHMAQPSAAVLLRAHFYLPHHPACYITVVV